MSLKWVCLSLFLLTAFVPATLSSGRGAVDPLVVFITDEALQTHSAINPGPDGLSQLEEIFLASGTRTESVGLQTPIPKAAKVVVLVGPMQRLPGDYVVRLWAHLSQGNHLLLAIDPPGQFGAKPDQSASMLANLLSMDFGIALQDALLAEHWFTNRSIADRRTAYSQVYPEPVVRHSLVDPLVDYDLPIEIWGARTMTVEPVGVDSHAAPLLVSWTGFGETNQQVFRRPDQAPAPVEVNPPGDLFGPLIVGALGENTRMQSRVVVLGDSAIVQNGFGLARRFQVDGPLHPGNYMLTDRLVRWLLELPVEERSDLYEGFTWIAIDGYPGNPPEPSIETWVAVTEAFSDIDFPIEYYPQRVGLLHDHSYLYITVEMAATPAPDTILRLDIDTDSDGIADVMSWADTHAIAFEQDDFRRISVPDGKLRIGTVLEARLPLRLMSEDAVVTSLCLTSDVLAELETYVICKDLYGDLGSETNTISPVDALFPGRPLATVLPARGNLRDGPGTDYELVTVLTRGQVMLPIGRDSRGDWIKVQNAAYIGWIPAVFLAVNTDVEELPVLGAP